MVEGAPAHAGGQGSAKDTIAGVKWYPLLMADEMVRATLEGKKTGTRRVVLQKRRIPGEPRHYGPDFPLDQYIAGPNHPSPYGVPGDRLWVREATWWPPEPSYNYTYYRATPRIGKGRIHGDGTLTTFYSIFKTDEEAAQCHREDGYKIRPSIFMPKAVCRLPLEVTGIRVERLQEITPEGCLAEGFHIDMPNAPIAAYYGRVAKFRNYWDALNAKRGYGWDTNPWVWVISFKRLPHSALLDLQNT